MSAPPVPASVVVRDSRDDDLPAIEAIYAHHVSHGLATFEEAPPSLAELRRRREEILAKGLPYIVAAEATAKGGGAGGAVLGYAYASTYRTRSAYRAYSGNSLRRCCSSF